MTNISNSDLDDHLHQSHQSGNQQQQQQNYGAKKRGVFKKWITNPVRKLSQSKGDKNPTFPFSAAPAPNLNASSDTPSDKITSLSSTNNQNDLHKPSTKLVDEAINNSKDDDNKLHSFKVSLDTQTMIFMLLMVHHFQCFRLRMNKLTKIYQILIKNWKILQGTNRLILKFQIVIQFFIIISIPIRILKKIVTLPK